jgi:hypothetical protein
MTDEEDTTAEDVKPVTHYEDAATFSDPFPLTLPSKDIGFSSIASDSDEDGKGVQKNPFLDPDVAAHWRAVYEKSQYECRSQFDPRFTWTEEEEKMLVKRLDWRGNYAI